MSTSGLQFHGLARLASEHGLDVRATVLRVATDLFCQNPARTPAETVRYTDLAEALLPQVDPATRRAVADKLAKAPHAPEKLLRLLLDDAEVTVATTIIQNSSALKLENFSTFLAECGPAEAAAVARRTDIDRATIELLAAHSSILVVEALLENEALRFDAHITRLLATRAAEQPVLAPFLFTHPSIEMLELTPLYTIAPGEIRQRIRTAIEASPARALPPVPIQAALELNEAIGSADIEQVGATLGKALHLDPAGIPRILQDPTGEVLVLSLAAAGIKRTHALRFLLTSAIDEVRMSVERIFAASDVYDATSRRIGRELALAIAGERRTQGGTFEPHMHPSNTPQRGFGTRRKLQIQKRPSRRTDVSGRP